MPKKIRTRKFVAVRVVLMDADSNLFQRDYVRGELRLGKQAFISYAVGDFIGIITGGEFTNTTVVSVEEIDYKTVIENRRYAHTSH
jgi:hypothetical protein